MFVVRGLHADYIKLLVDFCDGTKDFEKEEMRSITTWCKRWDEDTFADEYKPVLNRKTHEKVKPSPTASATGVDKQKDPAGTYPTPWQHLAAFDLNRINGRWKKIEEMKNCVHCGGHKDGTKFKSRVCPGSFACQILKDNHCKLTKIGKPIPKTPTPPGGATSTVVDPGPPIPEDADMDPSAVPAELVDTSSIETPNSFVWLGWGFAPGNSGAYLA